MFDRDFLVQAIQEATSSVFVTMLDSPVEMIGSDEQPSEMDANVVSLVGLTGAWSGTGSFCCSPAAASRLSARMLMLDPPADETAITDDVLDAVAELTNMIVGNIKNVLEERLGPMAISIPTVIFGRNFQYKSLTGLKGVVVSFVWGAERVDVKLYIAPTPEKYSLNRHRLEQSLTTA